MLPRGLATPAISTNHKKKVTAEDCKARKAAKDISKSSKTKAAKVLAEAGEGLSRSSVTVFTGSMGINHVDGTVTPKLVPVYDATGRVVSMPQVPENLLPPPVSADTPRGRQGDAPASRRTCR